MGPGVFALYVTHYSEWAIRTDVTLNRFQFNLFLLVMHIFHIQFVFDAAD